LFLIATMLFLLFPDGKVTSPEWIFVAWTAVIEGVMAALGEALGRRKAGTDFGRIGNPVAVDGAVGNILEGLGKLGFVLLALSCVASIAAPFIRLSRAREQERQQIKWFAYAAAVMVGGFLLTFTFGTSSELLWALGLLVGILGFAFLPVATGIAILKYRLYDIDRIINRTLVYGSLTTLLLLVYFGGVTATQAIFQTYTGQEELPQLVIVASTLVIAALFNPLRRRVQGFVDRRFYRRKYDAEKTLAAFNARLREETELEMLSGDVVGVVTETMQPAHVSLWLRSDTAAKGEGPANRLSRSSP
jgi:hypothetical protein